MKIHILHVWNVFRVITNFSVLSIGFLNFCASFIPSWLWQLALSFKFKWIGTWRSEVKDLKNGIFVKIRDVNTGSIDKKSSLKDDAAKMLDNRLQGNFVSKNAVNLPKRNLTNSEISLLSKWLNFIPTSNTIDNA